MSVAIAVALSVAKPSAITRLLSSALPCACATARVFRVGKLPGGRLDASEMPPLSGITLWNSLGFAATISGEVSKA